MAERNTCVIGATSFVGQALIAELRLRGYRITAFSRQAHSCNVSGVDWNQYSGDAPKTSLDKTFHFIAGTKNWICVAPIFVLSLYFDLILSSGAKRVIALSSTSRFTKNDSSDPAEQQLAQQLIAAEQTFQIWAEHNGIEWVILRPTLIYGFGKDKNITEIARFIRRFGFFPLLGQAIGARQPIHAADVAHACISVLESPELSNRAYNLSGGETLTYREMVTRIFNALGRAPRFITTPLWAFRLALRVMHLMPRYRHWSPAMADRMNRDMAFEHTNASRDFGFDPQPFILTEQDIPLWK